MSLELLRYSPARAAEWNDFVKKSWNGVFLFDRGFMDYHSDRFLDHSILAYEAGKLKAVLPANERDGVLYSHQGLTYGGWLLSERFPASSLEKVFNALEDYLLDKGITTLEYRQKPYIFARHASDTDSWLLWRGAYELWRRDLSFFFDMKNHAGFARDKRYRHNKSMRNNLRVEEKGDVNLYMKLVNENLQGKYQTSAVHSPEEVLLLQSRFPDNIMTMTVYQDELFLGGAWLFIDNDFVHTQYLHFNKEGRELCAAEFLVAYLIERYSASKRYFSFGASTEDNGRILNEGLASFKEGFGAACFCNDFYRKTLCK